MSSEESALASLRELGLNLYESKAYLALLAKGQISARELGQMTSIPQSRTYDVLSSLKSKGFALITPSSDKTYAPVEPETILPELYDKRRKEVQDEMIKVQKLTEERLERLQSTYSQAREQLKTISSEHIQVTNQPVYVIEGNENIEHAMLKLIDKAQKEFFRITRPTESRKNMFDPFYFLPGRMAEHFELAERRGVQIRTISLVREIPSLLGWSYQDEQKNQRRYLEEERDIPEKFVLVDGQSALLNLRDPVSKTFGSIGLVLESPPTCSILREHFESLWQRAESPSEVTRRMKSKTEEVISTMKQLKFTRAEISIYRSLCKNGYQSLDSLRKSLERYYSPDVVTLAVQRLLKEEILLQNDWLKSLMAEIPHKVMLLLERNSR